MLRLYIILVIHLLILKVIAAKNNEIENERNYELIYAKEISESPPNIRVAKTKSKPTVIYERDRRLEFVNMAAIGGTKIEEAAARSHIAWGACHFIRCQGTTPDISKLSGSVWHIPLSRLLYGNDAALFTVVRDPYDRTLSYYYYTQRHKIDINVLNRKDYLNNWIKNILKRDNYYQTFFPAYDYVFDKKTGKQVVDYILRFETIQNDLSGLMQKFSLNLSFTPDDSLIRGATLDRDSLSDESIEIINEYFYNDFITFGYNMIEKNKSPAIGNFGKLFDRIKVESKNGKQIVKLESKPNVQYFAKVKGKYRLEFLHAAKNGGTAIEYAAADQLGVIWGACHFIPCPGTTPDIPKTTFNIWHDPFSRLLYGNDVALFSVVRDPYERTLSYYYYTKGATKGHRVDISVLNHAEYLNNWVKETMMRNKYYQSFLPAYSYIFDVTTGKQVVDYVLRFEQLENDFERLMKEFSLKISLKYDNVRIADAKLGIDAFSDESIEIINNYFYNDFLAFGYEMK